MYFLIISKLARTYYFIESYIYSTSDANYRFMVGKTSSYQISLQDTGSASSTSVVLALGDLISSHSVCLTLSLRAVQ